MFLSVSGAKNSAVRLLLRDCQCLLSSRKSRSVLPAFGFFFFVLIINRSSLARFGSPVTSRYLYYALFVSSFTFCLNCRVDVASVEVGSVNDVLPILLVSGVL